MKKTDWEESFIEEFAGHPVRVAVNLFIIGTIGVLLGHFVFGVEPCASLVIGALLPALGAIVSASHMKAQRRTQRP